MCPQFRSILWQLVGGLVALIVIFASMGELIWCSLYFSDPTNVTPFWTIRVHALASAAIVALVAYRATRRIRERAVLAGGLHADVDDFSWEFRLGALKFEIQLAFLVPLGVWTAMSGRVSLALLAALAIVVHEFGHAFAARRLGKDDVTIVLHGVGGSTFVNDVRLTRRDHIRIALAGPFAGVLLGVVSLIAWRVVHAELVKELMITTFVWSAINLLPIRPLDGSVAQRRRSRRWSSQPRVCSPGSPNRLIATAKSHASTPHPTPV